MIIGTDFTLAYAAIPTSIAAIWVGWFTFRAATAAGPKVASAAKLEPRLDATEKMSEGWSTLLDAKDHQIVYLTKELDRVRAELQEALHPAGGLGPAAD